MEKMVRDDGISTVLFALRLECRRHATRIQTHQPNHAARANEVAEMLSEPLALAGVFIREYAELQESQEATDDS